MLSVLFILGGFVPLISTDFAAKVLSVDDGVITGRFSDSLLLSLPPCETFAGRNVDLEYMNVNTNATNTLSSIFTVANCSSGSNTVGSTALSRNIGYHLKDLSNGTEYKIHYKIGSNKSNIIMATTRSVPDYNGIDQSLPARSGAMVVITVILSLAMSFLLICLILSTVMSSGSN